MTLTTTRKQVTTTDAFRPTTLDEVVGQDEVKAELRVAIEAAQMRGELPDHMLFIGPAGTGKTTLALIVAASVNATFVPMMGPNLRRAADITGPLIGSWSGTAFFIDEIHRMYRPVQEVMFPVMEDGRLTMPNGNVVELPRRLFIGATTDPERLLTPMLDRFTRILRLRLYTPIELAAIAQRAARKLGCRLDDEAALAVGGAAEGVPRVALRIMRAARDYAYSEYKGEWFGAFRRVPGSKGLEIEEVERRPDPDPITIGEGAVRRVLSSSAYAWRLEGRDAG